MTVMHLISGGDHGGAKTHVLSLLRGLRQSISASLVCFQDGQFAQDAQAQGIDVYIIEARSPRKSLKTLKSLIRQLQPDILHCHGSRANSIALLLKWSGLKLPIVSTVHSDYKLDYLGRPFHNIIYGMTNRFALRRLDYRIGVSATMTRRLVARGYSPYNLFTIYNGIDFHNFMPIENKKAAYAELGVDYQEGDIIAGFGGRLDPVKDLPTMLKAFALVKDNCPRLKLVIAGDGHEEATLRSLAATLDIADRVYFIGWIPDIHKLFQLLDINLLTSLSETFTYVLLEGAQHRLPTVSSAVGGIPDLIAHERNGLLFEPQDATALAVHLQRLANDEVLRERLGDALHETVREKFTNDNTVATQLDIYHTILRRAQLPKKKRHGVMLCGAYGHDNVGDEAILQAALADIRAIDPDLRVTVLSRNPRSTRKHFLVDSVYIFNLPKLRWKLRHSRLFINGGGNLLQDLTSRRSLWFYLFTINMARRAKNDVLMYGCGIGPIYSPLNRRLTTRTLNKSVKAITLRESRSVEELRLYGVCTPTVTLSSDLAFSLPTADADAVDAYFHQAGIALDGNYFCFCLRQWPQFREKAELFGKLSDYITEQYELTPVFLPFSAKRDHDAAKAVMLHTRHEYTILPPIADPSLCIGVLARMQGALAMRLHALIFATSQSIPVMAIDYDSKLNAFMEYIENPLTTDLHYVTENDLTVMVDRMLSHEKSALTGDTMRTLAMRNRETLKQLLS
ncbi:MAG: polysaccharide pyruvyl transferase CsaB [Oscillospiraceae bacterium]|nr:polysaccharide pyruvyl transferase CsaB [Oscillospiraceae bacterium]